MKTLKTNKLNCYVTWINVNIPPKDYNDAEEMKVLVSDIRPLLKEEISEFVELQDKITEMQKDFAIGKIKRIEADNKLNDLNMESRKLELSIGQEEVELKFDDQWATVFVNFFNRVGRGWFNDAERYFSFEKQINAMNKQSKN